MTKVPAGASTQPFVFNLRDTFPSWPIGKVESTRPYTDREGGYLLLVWLNEDSIATRSLTNPWRAGPGSLAHVAR